MNTNNKLVKKFKKAAKKVAELYARLPEVVAVTIGGSLARQYTDMLSDIEMYVYYEHNLPSKTEIKNILNRLDAKLTRSKKLHWYHPSWGYHTFFAFNGIKFELGYRDIHETFVRMKNFKSSLILPKHGIHDTPFGHYESGVASCITECLVLVDKKGQIKQLKEYLADYPKSHIRDETFKYYIKDAKTILSIKAKYAALRNDDYNFNACVARAIRSLVISLFALNSTYYPGDKWNKQYLNKFKLTPKNYKKRMEEIFLLSELKKRDKITKFRKLLSLVEETKRLYKKSCDET